MRSRCVAYGGRLAAIGRNHVAHAPRKTAIGLHGHQTGDQFIRIYPPNGGYEVEGIGVKITTHAGGYLHRLHVPGPLGSAASVKRQLAVTFVKQSIFRQYRNKLVQMPLGY